MADNVDITPGTGATVAADDIGGALYQRVKVAFGDDGSGTDTSKANPLPVIQGTLSTSGYAIGEISNTSTIALSGLTWKLNDTTGTTLATLATSVGCRFVQLRSDQPLAWTTTGQVPNATTGVSSLGFSMVASTPIWIDVRNLSEMKFLNSSGSTAYLYAEAYV
jgi:hypothetical protein